ncbi:hypothetical protein WISP_118277 [Willisornis vidua]|uniref:Uncharacterized protein n=1 Tax=Willisornis vidua TaxID=1566151 RepID=A0ABQ9CYU9_9PASS|nr:hypothetical protein WISP_118277 [Willisornis vidua]
MVELTVVVQRDELLAEMRMLEDDLKLSSDEEENNQVSAMSIRPWLQSKPFDYDSHHVPCSRSALQIQTGVEVMSGESNLAGGHDHVSNKGLRCTTPMILFSFSHCTL